MARQKVQVCIHRGCWTIPESGTLCPEHAPKIQAPTVDPRVHAETLQKAQERAERRKTSEAWVKRAQKELDAVAALETRLKGFLKGT
jgi:hypothetical protein